MARAARLKVFSTPAGFDDALVAAPSRKAALQAWGARGDLFALGEASEVEDPDLAALALARPGEVVRRPRGDAAALLAAATRPPASRKPTPQPRPGAKPERAPPDRSALDASERDLSQAQAELDASLAVVDRDRARLDVQEAEIRRAGAKRLGALHSARDAAQRSFDAATVKGG